MRAATLTHVCLTTWGLATTASGEFGWTRGSESSIFSDLKGPFFKKKHDEKHRETLKKTEHSNEPNVSSRKSQARRRVEMQMKFNKAATPLTNCVGVKVLLTWKQNGRSFMNQKERCKNGWLPQLHREDVGNLSIPLGWLLCFIFFFAWLEYSEKRRTFAPLQHIYFGEWFGTSLVLSKMEHLHFSLLPLDVHCILPGWNCTASRPKVHSRACRKVPRPSRRLDGWIPGVRLDAIKCWSCG